MFVKFFYNSFIFIIIFFVFLFSGYTDAAVGPEYLLQGEDIRYDYQNNIISSEGNVVFRYQDLEVRSDNLLIDLQEGLIEAHGEQVELLSAEYKITGNYLYFDFENRKGELHQAKSEIGEISFSGGVIKVYSAREYSMLLEEALFTTCQLDSPHYSIRAKEVRIYPEGRIAGSQVTLWWRENRLFQLPGYVIYFVYAEEIDDEYEISSPVPVPSLGYSSQTGLTVEVIYPYQARDEIQGQISLLLEQQGVMDLKLQNSWSLSSQLTYISELEYYRNNTGEQVYGSYQGGQYQYTDDLFFESGINWTRRKEEQLVRDEWSSLFYTEYEGADYTATGLLNYDIGHKLSKEILYKEDNWQLEGEIDYFLIEESLRSWARLMVDPGWKPGKNRVFVENNFQQGSGNLRLETEQKWIPADNFTLEFTGDLRYNFSEWTFSDYTQQFGTNVKYASDYKISEDLSLQGEISLENSVKLQNFKKIMNRRTVLGTGLNLRLSLPEPGSFWQFSGAIAYEQKSGVWQSVNIGLSREYDCFDLGFNYDIGNDIIGFNINF